MATTTAQTAPAAAERQAFPWGKLLAWIVLILLILITLLPIWIVIKTAFSSQRSLFTAAESLLPSDPTVFNFRRALGVVGLDEMVAAGGSGGDAELPALPPQLADLHRDRRRVPDFLFGDGRLRLCAT